jgi:hypothetical protein
MARRDDRAYWAYVSEEQRRQPGCPARELCDTSRFQGTSIDARRAGICPAAVRQARQPTACAGPCGGMFLPVEVNRPGFGTVHRCVQA